MLVQWNGRRLNTAAIARQLGVTRPTVVARVQALERAGLVRLLPFLGGGMRPLLYRRLEYGEGQEAYKGHCIELIIARLSDLVPESSFFWWKTGRIRKIDLLAQVMEERIRFCFYAAPLPANRSWLPLAHGCRQGVIHRGYLLYQGSRAFIAAPAVQVVPLGAFLETFEDWILRFRTVNEAREERGKINRLAAARFSSKRITSSSRNPC